MLTEIDIESLPSFNIGFERGKAEGKAEGREEGKAEIVHSLLSRLGVTEVSELLGLSPEGVERIAAKGSDDDLPRDRR